MRPRELQRRDVLARAATLAAVGGVAGLAGCVEDGQTTAEGSPADEATPTDSPTPTPVPFAAEDWLPAPSTVGAGDSFGFGVLRPAALAPDADALGQEFYDELASVGGLLDLADVAPADVATHATFRGTSALEASFDREQVTGALTEGGYESTGSREGFEVLAPTADAERDVGVVAVGDGVLVVGRERGDRSAEENAAVTVDAGTGAGERLVDAKPTAGEFVERGRDGDLSVGLMRTPPEETNARVGQFAHNTGIGYDFAVDGATTELTMYLTFESPSDADADAVSRWIESARTGSVFDRLEDRTVETDGAVVLVSGTLSTDYLAETPLVGPFASSGSEVEENVQAGASVLVDDEADVVEVTWTSNQNADYLTARFDPEDGDAVERRIDELGGSVTYEGSDGATVRTLVKAHAGERSTVIVDKTAEL